VPIGWDILALGILGLCVLIGAGWLARRILDNPLGTVEGGLAWAATRLYVRVVHRLTIVNAERLPSTRQAGPLILVANHSAGVDPVLLQAACPFLIRFVMAQDMRRASLEPLWRWMRVIFVDREKGGAESLRDAIRHLRDGGVIGIFPEGGLERPPRHLLPFQPGVGLLIKRSGAPVLPIVIRGTPHAATAWGSLIRRSRSVIEIMPVMEFGARGLSAPEIARELHTNYQRWTGWANAPESMVREGISGSGARSRADWA
jgi:1-acyl-sn-glycerol-3-phosphate acyltransferase